MIILASKSPRRREILHSLGIKFEILDIDADESVTEPLPPAEYVSVIAKRKAVIAVNIFLKKYSQKNSTIIAADTVVEIGGKILGKPKDKQDAFDMLKSLEGKRHSVYTGLCVVFIKDGGVEYIEDCCRTEVYFKPLTDAEIEEYINTPEPYDKAGAYAIQGDSGKLIERIDGDYTNVVGLPVDRVVAMLDNNEKSKSHEDGARSYFVSQSARDTVRKRQAEGIAAARERGVHLGRPIKKPPENFGKVVKQWEEGKLHISKVLKKTGLKEATFYNRLREYRRLEKE